MTGRWLASILLPPAVLAASAWLAPHVPAGSLTAILAGVFAFACVGAEVIVAGTWAPPLSRRSSLGLLVPAALLVAIALLGAAIPAVLAAVLVTACLLGAGSRLGATVGHAIAAPGHLLVVAIVSALVDVFSVLHPSGPTSQIIRIEAALSVLALPWPILGTAHIQPVLGVGDVVFAGLYLGASRKHGLSLRRTTIGLALGLAIAFGAAVATERGIPALPFMGAAVVALHPAARRIPPADRANAAIGIGGLALLFLILFALRFA